MKATLTIIATLISLSIFAQYSEQNIISQYAIDHLGEKVGKGLCFDLVKEACEQQDRDWFKNKWDHRSKYKISAPEEGAVIVFNNAKFQDGYTTGFHIAIICSVSESGAITIAEQNICPDSDKKTVRSYGQKMMVCKDSDVEMRTINTGLLVSGKVSFYKF